MGRFSETLDSMFPGRVQRREEALRDHYLTRYLQSEISALDRMGTGLGEGMALEESVQQLGDPWQLRAAGLTMDAAYRQGYPNMMGGFDAARIVHDDSLRGWILDYSRHLYDQHPHAKALVESSVVFAVGESAWTVSPAPKLPSPASGITPVQEGLDDSLSINSVGGIISGVNPDLFNDDPVPKKHVHLKPQIDHKLEAKMTRLWKNYKRCGRIHPQLGWVGFWTEAYRRYKRDGEVFIFLGNDKKDARLSPRFMDPKDFVHPTGVSSSNSFDSDSGIDPLSNGIEVDPDDPATILRYWYRPHSRKSQRAVAIDADRIIHVKNAVDTTIKRGLPLVFVCRDYLKHFDTWIMQSLKHQKTQSLIAIMRYWEKMPLGALNTVLEKGDVYRRERPTQAGGTITQHITGDVMPVVDAPKGMKMEYTKPSGNFADSEILARRVLLACAAGAGLSEAMVAADASNANYASSRIAQLVPMKTFKREQGEWAEIVQLFYEKWCYAEAAAGRLPPFIGEWGLEAEITPTKLPDFEGELSTEHVIMQHSEGIVSKQTARESLGLDHETEDDRVEQELNDIGSDSDPLVKAFAASSGFSQPSVPGVNRISPVAVTDGSAVPKPGGNGQPRR